MLMTLSSPYLFLELALLVFLLGFGWEQWRLSEMCSRWFLLPAVCLACFWFAIDQVALRLNLWTFPVSETSSFRLLSLPVEEYVLFFLHTLVCLIFLRHYSQDG
jgi:lycopene cyclase domain-containing protein